MTTQDVERAQVPRSNRSELRSAVLMWISLPLGLSFLTCQMDMAVLFIVVRAQ